MEKEKANLVAQKLAEIKKTEEQLKEFKKTKEFCCITINGEDGNEVEHKFQIGYRGNKKEIERIRNYIYNILTDNLKKLENELQKL